MRVCRFFLPLGAAIALAISAQAASFDFPAYFDDPAGKPYQVDVSVAAAEPGSRVFTFKSSAPQRDHTPATKVVTETPGAPALQSGSILLDGVFALTVDDAKQASVETIKDWAYNGNQPIACHCFETGEKWPYVWTRDLAYSLDLGLAGFDPERAVNGLNFKTSSFRSGFALPPDVAADGMQIVQDTGSGGSWPVSTDRVVWALGAEATLAVLDGPQKEAFAHQAYAALKGTLEADRLAAFDLRDGLYTGEQSFLDWREQTYAPWMASDLSALAQSKALSTNVLEYRALGLAAALAGSSGDGEAAARYASWAKALGKAINRKFWNARDGLYSTYTTADIHAAPLAKYDLLGNSLAIVSGLAGPARARTVLSRYPFAPFGPPVVWPEAANIPVYHNRAMWPFVTAYALRAAARVHHVAAFDAGLSSLLRGVALNLSNMENEEWLTGLSFYDDGPVVDSRRQLWSIAASYGTVTGTIFGWHPQRDGVEIAPFLTAATRRMFGAVQTARLTGLSYRGTRIDIVLHLPEPVEGEAYYPIHTIRLNDTPVKRKIAAAQFGSASNRIDITFAPARRSHARVTMAPPVPSLSHDDPRVFLPATPAIADIKRIGAQAGITLQEERPTSLRYTVLRDGRTIAHDLSGPVLHVPLPRHAERTVCYSVSAVNPVTRLASLPSEPACLRGTVAQTIAIDDPRVQSDGTRLDASDGVAERTLQLGLGRKLAVDDIVIAKPGLYAVRFVYDNHVYLSNTGITNAVKQVAIADATGRVQQAVIQMPHIAAEGTMHPLRLSTRGVFVLKPGRYRLTVGDFFNMSALQANETYNNPGGKDGPVNEARIAGIELDEIAPSAGP